jgi:hypothetical protein
MPEAGRIRARRDDMVLEEPARDEAHWVLDRVEDVKWDNRAYLQAAVADPPAANGPAITRPSDLPVNAVSSGLGAAAIN